jgi:PKD repeat protein
MRRTSPWVLSVATALVVLCASSARGACTTTCSAIVPFAGNAGVAVQFQGGGSACDCTGPAQYTWDFGDSQTSNDVSPMHTYAAAGTYNWQLTVSADSATCTKSGQIRITASGNAPRPGTYSGTTSQGLPFSLTVNSVSQITDWSVGFTCSSTSGTANVSTFCSINNGTFSCAAASCIPFSTQTSLSGQFDSSTTVSGTAAVRTNPAISACCSVDPTFSASFTPAPLAASASADTTSGISPLLVNFTGGASGGSPPYSFSWNFGDCSPTDSAQNPSHSFGPGNWSAVLTVTDSTLNAADAIVPVSALPADTVLLSFAHPGSAVVNQPFTMTVSARDAGNNVVTDYDGTVHFTSNDGGATLPGDYAFQPSDNGAHTFTNEFVLTQPGTRSITAEDAANAINGTVFLTVGFATSTTVTTSPNASAQGQMVTLTATVSGSGGGPITGNVSFFDGEIPLGSGASSGQASIQTSALAGGPHSITATYQGDSNYLTSTSSAHTHYVLLSAPAGVTATATSPTSVTIVWDALDGAANYEVQRSTNNVAFASRGFSADEDFVDTASANTAYFYRVRGRDAGNNFGAASAADLATTVIFTDDPLVAGTVVKTVHITQLRTAVNALRSAAGDGAASFTDPTVNNTLRVKGVHVQDLRTFLNAARSDLLLSTVTFTDPTLTAATKVKAAHVMELRAGVK